MTSTQDLKVIVEKKAYTTPQVEKVALDHEISIMMMSLPPTELIPNQDPLMSLKGFRLFK
jgi:hypothetical protein